MLALTQGESGLLEIRDYLRILRRNWTLVLGLTLAGLLAAGLTTVLIKPTYTAETQLFVAIQGSGSIQELAQGNTFGQARVQSYVKTVTTPTVLQPVIDSLGLHTTPQTLAKKIKASTDLNTVLITVAVSDESPIEAAAIAQGVSESLVKAVDSLEKPKVGGESPVKLSVVTPAVAPTRPSAPNTPLFLVAGLLGGLVVGISLAFVRATLDTRVRGEEDLRRAIDAPVLGGIAFDQDATKKPLITQTHSQSPRAESFRQLRTNLQFAHVSHQNKTILITSSVPGEGKSTTATNLAISMAETGQSVVLIDADLRRPMVSEYLGLERSAGLTTALVGKADINDLLQPWGTDDLFVLTSGQIPPNPSELLGSESMKQLIVRLEHAFDAVIIDAPPLLPVTDAAVLAQHVGGVVLVVGAQRTRLQDIQRASESLSMVAADLMGVVMNRLPVKGPDAYAYSYYSYQSTAERSSTPADRSQPSSNLPGGPVEGRPRNASVRRSLRVPGEARRSADFDDSEIFWTR